MTYKVYYCVKCKMCYSSSFCTTCNKKDLKTLINEALVITRDENLKNVCYRMEDYNK